MLLLQVHLHLLLPLPLLLLLRAFQHYQQLSQVGMIIMDINIVININR